MALLAPSAFAQEDAPNDSAAAQETNDSVTVESAPEETAESSEATPQPELLNRLIYIPFRSLQRVLKNNDATAVVPYAEYLELLRHYWKQHGPDNTPDAVITKASYLAKVEEEVARVTVELEVTVLKKSGWATLPLSFGKSAIGTITSDEDDNTLLKGADSGAYELLLRGVGKKTVSLELLAAVSTTPEARSFELNCPTVGINELQVTIPEGDQTIQVSPVEVLLPAEGNSESQTVAKAALGATQHFAVRWFPRAGSRPQMDLLTSVTNNVVVNIEPQLIQTTNSFTWEVLRGEMQEATVLVPTDSRVIDVVAKKGRIQSWETTAADGHQQIRVQLIKPVTGKLQIDIQTERIPKGDTLHLLGRTDDNVLHGLHADNVVREAGLLAISTDPSLTLITQQQSGVKRSSVPSQQSGRVVWEFTGIRSQLAVQVKPVEPRLTAQQSSQLVFSDAELRLMTHIDFMVERAGVFELQLKYPESLTIDSVRADGMSEFNVDKDGGTITLSLTNRRQGSIGVDVRGHQAFDAVAENAETVLPGIEPLHVERSTGQVTVFAPRFLDVITIDEKRTGLNPASGQSGNVGRAVAVSSWNFTQHPWALAVRTSHRPAQVDAVVATTAQVEPEIVRFDSEIRLTVRNAGLDTFRIAAPESIADDIRFRSLNSQHVIQQRDKAQTAEDGWVTWTLVLQNEATGLVRLGAGWEQTAGEADEQETRSFSAEPLRVLTPYPDDSSQKRKVTLTQVRGELRLLRHDSLSITAEANGDTTESIDVRELEFLPTEGFLAFRYFAQPAGAVVSVREHAIHEVVATVVSKAAIEIVTERQPLASYRCRYRVTTSKRQRLRIDVPVGSELQAPLLNDRRTTFEPADDVTADEHWQPYYINISRKENSDESFLLTFQLRCPIVEPETFPWEGNGGEQLLRTPRIDPGGSAVVQETRVGVWTPDTVSLFGKPANWTPIGHQSWSPLRPLQSSTDHNAAAALSEWVAADNSSSDFAHQGNATVFRALGSETTLQTSWWNRPFMVAIISGAIVLIGLILRPTSWENRITLILLALVAVAIWRLFDAGAATQVVSAGSPGLLAVAGIWLTSLLLGRSQKTPTKPEDSDNNSGSASEGNNDSPPDADSGSTDTTSPGAQSTESPPDEANSESDDSESTDRTGGE